MRETDVLIVGAGISGVSLARELSKYDVRVTVVEKEADVSMVVTACPLCQANFEMRQGKDQNFPVFYFTELLALAFDVKEVKDTLKKHLIDVSKFLVHI